MKYIKSIKESQKDLIGIIKECFGEILDNDKLKIQWYQKKENHSENIIIIIIDIKDDKIIGTGTEFMKYRYETKIEDLIDNSKLRTELLLDIDVSLKRIAEYNIDFTLKSNKIGEIIIHFK